MDDEIVADLFEKFPELKFEDALRNLDEDQMKSKAGKEKWRNFILPVSVLRSSLRVAGRAYEVV
jgi:hypothetical protein